MSYITTVTDWLLGASGTIIQNAAYAFLLFALGIALGFLVRGVIVNLLRVTKFDELVAKLHINDVFGKLSVSEVFADIAEIAIIISFTVQALDVLGWSLIGEALSGILYWLPGVVAALVIFLVFYAIGRAVQNRMEQSKAAWSVKLAPFVLMAIAVFGAIVGLDQVGIDTSLIQQALLIVIFGFALAFALAVGIAVGLGLKDDASEIVGKALGKKPKARRKTSRKKK